jgi:hypothetical protein
MRERPKDHVVHNCFLDFTNPVNHPKMECIASRVMLKILSVKYFKVPIDNLIVKHVNLQPVFLILLINRSIYD